LGSDGLGPREFLHVFAALIKLAIQTHVRRGGDSWVITINPRHRAFYCRAMGFVPIGPRRPHPSVRAHPAEPYLLDEGLIAARAPDEHRDFFVEELPEAVLSSDGRPSEHALFFAERSTRADLATIEALLRRVVAAPDTVFRRIGDQRLTVRSQSGSIPVKTRKRSISSAGIVTPFSYFTHVRAGNTIASAHSSRSAPKRSRRPAPSRSAMARRSPTRSVGIRYLSSHTVGRGRLGRNSMLD
jgi:N-acyl amino acid synthase FeeM